jgi:hypothetical protein
MLKADKNVIICLVPTAVGGTRIDLWKPGAYDEATKTHPWDDAIRRIKAALPSGELKGIIWHQGESDANATRSGTYESKLRDLIERFRSELNAPNVPFILGELGDFKPGENKEIPVINAIIKNVASTTKNSGFAEAKGLHTKEILFILMQHLQESWVKDMQLRCWQSKNNLPKKDSVLKFIKSNCASVPPV